MLLKKKSKKKAINKILNFYQSTRYKKSLENWKKKFWKNQDFFFKVKAFKVKNQKIYFFKKLINKFNLLLQKNFIKNFWYQFFFNKKKIIFYSLMKINFFFYKHFYKYKFLFLQNLNYVNFYKIIRNMPINLNYFFDRFKSILIMKRLSFFFKEKKNIFLKFKKKKILKKIIQIINKIFFIFKKKVYNLKSLNIVKVSKFFNKNKNFFLNKNYLNWSKLFYKQKFQNRIQISKLEKLKLQILKILIKNSLNLKYIKGMQIISYFYYDFLYNLKKKNCLYWLKNIQKFKKLFCKKKNKWSFSLLRRKTKENKGLKRILNLKVKKKHNIKIKKNKNIFSFDVLMQIKKIFKIRKIKYLKGTGRSNKLSPPFTFISFTK